MGNAAPEDGGRLTRRDFLGLGRRMGLGAVRKSADVLGALTGGATGPLPSDGPEVDIGTLHAIAESPLGSVSTDFAGNGQFYIVRVPEGIVALDRRCPGQGCAVLWRLGFPALPSDQARGWDRGQFRCLTHGAQFDRYGVPASGCTDAGDQMLRLAIIERDGRLVVRLGNVAAPSDQQGIYLLPQRPDPA